MIITTPAKLVLLILVALLCSVTVFLLCYHKDNKYTQQGPKAQNGILHLSEQDLQNYPVVHLAMGWEL